MRLGHGVGGGGGSHPALPQSFHHLCLDNLQKAAAVQDMQQYILRQLDYKPALHRHPIRKMGEMLN